MENVKNQQVNYMVVVHGTKYSAWKQSSKERSGGTRICTWVQFSIGWSGKAIMRKQWE